VYPGGGTGTGCYATGVITPTNMLENDLFHDIDPLRSAQEAVKNFAARLDPKFDQIGVVGFSNPLQDPRVKLQCLRYEQAHNAINGQRGCFDPTANPISYTRTIQAIEDHINGGGTNIAMGLREGLEELGISIDVYNPNVQHTCSTDTSTNGDKKACDRQGAARRVVVLMTDGSPSATTGCPGSYIWRGRVGGGGSNNDYDCAMFYASQAADNNVVLYTIGIGAGANKELLTAMAEGTDPNPVAGDDGFYFNSKGGKYFPAAKPSDLDSIFQQILENIFVRIVG